MPDDVGSIVDAISALAKCSPGAFPDLAAHAQAVTEYGMGSVAHGTPAGLVALAKLLEEAADRLKASAVALERVDSAGRG
jgi:hypothetical protein